MAKSRSSGKLLGVGAGTAGLLGALAIALRYAVRPPTKARVPDTISSGIFARKALQTSVGHIVYHESGQGRPLIFVHGVCIGASSYEWSKVYPAFASRFRVLALDLVGFGESERPNIRLSEEHYVRLLVDFIRSTCWQQSPILIGSGLGGGFCAHLASQHPELASRLILLNPTGLSDFGKERLPLRTKLVSRIPLLNRFLYLNHQSTHSAIGTWLARFGFSDPARVTSEMVDVFTTCARQYGAEHAIRSFHGGRLNFDLEKRLRDVRQPVALLWGDRTKFPPVEWAQRFRASARPCPLTVLENVAALAALEDPPQLIAALDDQLHEEIRVFGAG